MASVTLTLEEYEALVALVRGLPGTPLVDSEPMRQATPKKRKVSNYSTQFGKELKKLKALHPRTKITALMKRAHRATRRSLKR